MKKQDGNIGKHYLYPSTLFVHRKQHKVVTVLGSCISVCLYDTKLKVGGINHFMLPLWNGNGLATPKYGNVAVKKLIQSMEAMGCQKKNMIAKIFGGANQINSSANIGSRNAQIAFDYMEEEGIKVVAKSVGGTIGRKIIFDTHTAEVMMKYVKKEANGK